MRFASCALTCPGSHKRRVSVRDRSCFGVCVQKQVAELTWSGGSQRDSPVMRLYQYLRGSALSGSARDETRQQDHDDRGDHSVVKGSENRLGSGSSLDLLQCVGLTGTLWSLSGRSATQAALPHLLVAQSTVTRPQLLHRSDQFRTQIPLLQLTCRCNDMFQQSQYPVSNLGTAPALKREKEE